jgi:dTDP-glucose 4,6-dehydratase
MDQPKTILVTGGAGFIGSNFVLGWRASGHGRVINVDKLTYAGNAANLAQLLGDPDHILVKGDIADIDLLERLMEKYRPGAIVHFAAETHVDRSIRAPGDFVQTNVVGTCALLRCALAYWEGLPGPERSAFRFLHISTDEVFGSLGPSASSFSELSPYLPNSPYAASKAGADHMVRAFHHTYGLPVLVTNCSNNYGPFQFPEKFIPLLINNAFSGRPLPVYGDGLNVRDWLYVGDHCDALHMVLNGGKVGERYNIGGNCEMTNLQVVEAVCAVLDELRPALAPHFRLLQFVSDRPGHDRRYAVDCRKTENELGWKPRHSFASGIRKTIDWYLANGDWLENVSSGAYRDWVKMHYAQV